MKREVKYQTASALRMALEERLNCISKEAGQDIMRLRRHVAFDRLLARLFSNRNEDLILKGGYALEIRLRNARATRDIDLSFKNAAVFTGANKSGRLREYVQNLASTDLGDHFEFIISKMTLELENAPYGGCRFPVETRLAGRLFIRFDMDLAAGDDWMGPHEELQTPEWLEFPGIHAPAVFAISTEQQFAEKLHAYSMPRTTMNSRVKDIVDLYLLLQGSLDPNRLRSAVMKTFTRRESHTLSDKLPDPPGKLDLTIQEAGC